MSAASQQKSVTNLLLVVILFMRKQFHLIRGLPGSGKSTLASQISMIKDDIVILEPELTDKHTLLQFATSPKKSSKLKIIIHRHLLRSALQSLNSDKPVIWTQAWTNSQGIEFTLRWLVKHLQNMDTTMQHTLSDLIDLAKLDFKIITLHLNNVDCKQRVIKRFERGEHIWDGSNYETYPTIFENLVKPPLSAFNIDIQVGNLSQEEVLAEYLKAVYPEI